MRIRLKMKINPVVKCFEYNLQISKIFTLYLNQKEDKQVIRINKSSHVRSNR